jgi:phage major head subunit gpT-like protein
MALANTVSFPNQLDKTIDKMFYDFLREYPLEYSMIAKSDGKFVGGVITEAQASGLGPMQQVVEGQATPFDYFVDGYKKSRTATEYKLGFQVTEKMREDELFGVAMKMDKALAKSAARNPEAKFFDLFNSGFATHLGMDGQYIFDASGRTLLKTGEAQNNCPSAGGSLSETTYQAALEYMYKVKDQTGWPAMVRPSKLLVPVELATTGHILLNTIQRPGSMDNDTNWVKDNVLNGNVQLVVSRNLTSAVAWFLLADEHDFRLIWIRNTKLMKADDATTGNRLFYASQRFGTFCNDTTGCYGNPGA